MLKLFITMFVVALCGGVVASYGGDVGWSGDTLYKIGVVTGTIAGFLVGQVALKD